MKPITHKCSFCQKVTGKDERLFSGPAVYICEDCVKFCSQLMKRELEKANTEPVVLKDLPKPSEIKKILDDYVIGQERTKKQLSVSVKKLMVLYVGCNVGIRAFSNGGFG